MVLSIIFHFLKAVLSRVIKFIAWLLVALSLWVPLLYTIVFVIICGLTHKSLSAYSSWYFGGLAISFIISFLISTFIYERKLAQKKKAIMGSRDNLQKVKEKEQVPTIKKREEPTFTQENISDNIAKMELENGQESNDTASKYNFISYGNLNEPKKITDTGFLSYNLEQNLQNQNELPQNQGNVKFASNNDQTIDNINFEPYSFNETSFSPPPSQSLGENEKPMIFATRSDPNVLIYEYTNRLEFYKKTLNGLVLIKTQYKQANFY